MKKLMKTLTVLMCAVALVAGSVAGTFAYLTAKTNTIANTFTAGNINITLTETEGTEKEGKRDFKMIPGLEIAKDPTVTVLANSEACWLFVKVVETEDFDTYLTYAMATGWEEVDGNPGIYYREVSESNADQAFSVLAGDKVTATVAPGKTEYELLGQDGQDPIPELTFTAYAVQQVGFATAAAAWAQASTLG